MLPAAGVSVLLVVREQINSHISDVQTKLKATSAFTTVDIFDATSTTPSLSTLQPYSAVLVWCYYDGSSYLGFASASGLGDVLAQYWDGGGAVVVASHANEYSTLQGRFGTGTNGYILIDGASPAGQEFPSDSLGTILEPQSPLMTGVASLSASTAIRSTGPVINGGVIVAKWASNGRPLVVRGVKAGRQLVALNMWPPSQSVAPNLWYGDGALLMRNALLYSACIPCASTGTYERGYSRMRSFK
jgi:hypothetical protein